VLWRQNVAAELTSAVFTEDSSCVLALGKGIFKVGRSTCPRNHVGGRPLQQVQSSLMLHTSMLVPT
jgi:hypothetical protein